MIFNLLVQSAHAARPGTLSNLAKLESPATGLGVSDLVAQSGMVAKIVLLLLLFASVVSWSIMLMKWRSLKRAERLNHEFLDFFWKGKSIEDVVARTDQYKGSPIAQTFKMGVKELKKIPPAELDNSKSLSIENIQRALSRSTFSEIAICEQHLGWLATTASAAPFVGLFGTVWGIMNSFQNIGATGAASLAVVAPGISEALVTTAAGIGAAIPAVIAYNHFVNRVKRIAVDLDCFNQDFLNIIQRSLIGKRPAGFSTPPQYP